MDIALNIDKNYVKYCAILICSIKKHNENACYHILHNDLTLEDQEEIMLHSGAGRKIIFYHVDSTKFEKLPKSQQWPEAIYYRLLIANIINKEVNKVLYLDCDILVRGSLNELFAIDMEGVGLAAVEDVLSPLAPMLENINCSPDYGYFNSGVMLINTAYWRDRKVLEDIFDFINKNVSILQHPDQDALNAIFSGKWMKLNYRWNFLRSYQNLYYDHTHMLSDYNLETKNYPVIIHFSGVKPWSPKSRSIFKFQYHEAMKVAKYEELVPKPTLLDRLEYVIIRSLDKTNIKKFRINYFL